MTQCTYCTHEEPRPCSTPWDAWDCHHNPNKPQAPSPELQALRDENAALNVMCSAQKAELAALRGELEELKAEHLNWP